ncbi:MAG: fluoride efflux transporter CrcB [Bacteroidota bacterium]
MMNWIAVFIGGGLGSLARYGLSFVFTSPSATVFPWATLAANTISSLIIGFLMGMGLAGKETTDSVWKSLLAVGFCGGFSTFSAFSMETIELAKSGMMQQAIIYATSSLMLCLGATLAGMWFVRQWFI